jgi:DNA helicase-2/ATP-dependent DNA helicase PcrA
MPGNITQNGPVDSYDQRPPKENNAFSKYKNFTARRKAASGKPSGLTRNKQGKLISLNKAGKMSSSNKNFKADDPSKITEGSIVEHQRFGKGKVIRLDDEPGNKKATVFFEEINEHKHLLLKFAKLRIIQ